MPIESLRNLRNLGQELFELGPKGAAFRVAWEISRHGSFHRKASLLSGAEKASRDQWIAHLPFPDPLSVANAVRPDRAGCVIPADGHGRPRAAR
jgi:hypothetical protein